MTQADKMNPETAPQSDADPEPVAPEQAEPAQPAQATDAALTEAESGNDAEADAGTDEDTEADAEDLASLPPQTLLERLRAATAENARAQDGLLRAQAEIENVRRRAQNEMVAARKFAIEGFAEELLGVRDSLERAAEVVLDEGADDAVRQMKEGLGLTLKQFDIALAKFAVVEVEAGPGARFDPQRHQAISTAPSDECEADHIVSVVQKGFLLKERLLRPAMVVVAVDAA